MAGLCGVIGDDCQSADAMAEGLVWTGEERIVAFDDRYVSIRGQFLNSSEAITATHGDTNVWIWGELYGSNTSEGYQSRPIDNRSTAEYLAGLYETSGISAIDGLNGEFIAVIYDAGNQTVSLCTDRLGIRDTYYTHDESGNLAFSTQVQALSLLPDVTPTFDPDMFLEYFTARRTFGVRTPLVDTFRIPSGSKFNIDATSGTKDVLRYWHPRFRPSDKPFSFFVDELVTRLRAAVADRTREDRDWGLLLSGGSDSRLVLAGLLEQVNVTAYHMADWMNDEARTAERVALTAEADFELLRRDIDYHVEALQRNPKLSNFLGRFDQAHAEGFLSEIASEVEVLADGLVANHLFGGVKIPLYSISLPPFGTLQIPISKPMATVDDFLDQILGPTPVFLADRRNPRRVIREYICQTGNKICHHGLTYESARDLFLFADFIPLSNKNGTFMAQSIRQHLQHTSPLLDNRIVNLALQYPVSYRCRKNLVNAALARVNRDLADIPHSETGTPPNRSFAQHYVRENLRKLNWKYGRDADDLPQPHMSYGPWPRAGNLLREQREFREILYQHRATIESLPLLSWEGVVQSFEDHQSGKNRMRQLYRLLTLLQMPVTRRVVEGINRQSEL